MSDDSEADVSTLPQKTDPQIQNRQKPERIVSLAPNYTEILFALGVGDQLVGRSDFCDFPLQAQAVPSVGSLGTPNWERLLAVQPTLVLATRFQDDRDWERLKKRQVDVYCSDIYTINELYITIQNLAQRLNCPVAGARLVANLRSQTAAIKSASRFQMITQNQSLDSDTNQPVVQNAISRAPRVLILVSARPLCCLGRNAFQADLVRTLGVINVADDLDRPYVNVSPEKIIQWNPDVILYPSMDGAGDPEELYNYPGWQNVSAVHNRRVYTDLSADLLFRPGPRFPAALKEIQEHLDDKQK